MGASTVDLTVDTFEETVTKEGTVIVDFWADWCGPCKMFAPTFEKVAGDNPDVTFAKIDTEAEQALASQLEIRAIPTLMAFRDGVLVYRDSGALPEAGLRQLVEQLQELDMDEVRKQIDEQESAG